MFFTLSKLFWAIARPLNFLFLCILAAALAGRLGARRTARLLFAASALLFVAFGFTQLPDWIVHRMETAVAAGKIDAPPAGIIVLGGGLSANNQTPGDGYHLGESADRIVKGLALKRRYPDARLIYSGGLGSLSQRGTPETGAAAMLVDALYADEVTIEYEGRSRNTWENARFTAQMLGDDAGGPWVLVTSGFHMPRAIACFRAAGVDVIPAPTDFRADPIGPPFLAADMAGQFLKLNLVVKELIGLLAYRLTGRIDTLFVAE